MSNALIFISYSHKDAKWKERLEEQLGVLEQEGDFAVWTDTQIGAGEDWYQKIDEALKKACVAILLVSASSLTSKFILKKEVKDLLQLRQEKDKRIFPIIIKDCLWEKVKWLAAMQVRPRDGIPLQQKRGAQIETALKQIAAEIAEIVGTAAGESLSVGSKVQPQTPERAIRKGTDEEAKRKIAEELQASKERTARLESQLRAMETESGGTAQPSSGLASTYQVHPIESSEGELPKRTQDDPEFRSAQLSEEKGDV